MLELTRVIADSADVIGHKSINGFRDRIVGDFRIIDFTERLHMHKREMAHVEKALDLPAMQHS